MEQAFVPSLNVSVDEKTGNVRAAYLRVRKGEVAETKEVSEGRAFADYTADGVLLGIELLAPCTVEVLDRVTAHEPEAIKQFLHGSLPRDLISA